MSYLDVQFAELQALVADLGKDGGLISPSIYDTAQVIRLYPPSEGPEPAIEWLLQQQHRDGGWGEPSAPYARDVPTLAATLALHRYAESPKYQAAMEAGIEFLAQQAAQWIDFPIDALPIATEMILPYLLEEAHRAGLHLDRKPYAKLYHLRDRKCRMLSGMPLQVGTAPTHSWEALGRHASSIIPDQSGGIGHSPAATAAWLHHNKCSGYDVTETVSAKQYLVNSAAATGLHIPGVVPNVWSIKGFELAYAPYTLLVTNLFKHPLIEKLLVPLLDELSCLIERHNGVSFGECFTPDGDDTGLALAVLQAAGRSVSTTSILQFKHGDHFCTFRHELNPSIFTNAHVLYGLAYAGERYAVTEQFLKNHQTRDGRWLADKLHTSWLYTTLEVMIALSHLGATKEIAHAVTSLLTFQHEDGGWGSGDISTRVETSYALIALSIAQRHQLLCEAGKKALQRGRQWLLSVYAPNALPDGRFWCGKELYAPYRVDRIYELSALLSTATEESDVTVCR